MLIFPPVMFVAGEFLTIPGPLLIILLFLAAIPAITPYLLKQAPFGYWVLVCCGWMGAGGVGAFLLMIIRLVMGTPIDGQG